jgi:hypothetical protein
MTQHIWSADIFQQVAKVRFAATAWRTLHSFGGRTLLAQDAFRTQDIENKVKGPWSYYYRCIAHRFAFEKCSENQSRPRRKGVLTGWLIHSARILVEIDRR